MTLNIGDLKRQYAIGYQPRYISNMLMCFCYYCYFRPKSRHVDCEGTVISINTKTEIEAKIELVVLSEGKAATLLCEFCGLPIFLFGGHDSKRLRTTDH